MKKTKASGDNLTAEQKQEIRRGMRVLGEEVLPIIKKYIRNADAHAFISEEVEARHQRLEEGQPALQQNEAIHRFIHADMFHILYDAVVDRTSHRDVIELSGKDADDFIRGLVDALKPKKGDDHEND